MTVQYKETTIGKSREADQMRRKGWKSYVCRKYGTYDAEDAYFTKDSRVIHLPNLRQIWPHPPEENRTQPNAFYRAGLRAS